MKSNIKAIIYLFILGFFFYYSTSQGNDNFGQIYIAVDGQDSLELDVRTAFLYRNVDVKYDSTILIQNDENSEIRLYPQIKAGNNNVLRIMAGVVREENPFFFDMFFILGDTVEEKVRWINESKKIFITYNGMLHSQKIMTKNINGNISFTSDKNKQFISGKLKLGFEAPLISQDGSLNKIKLNGSFELAVGDYRDLTVGKNLSDLEAKNRMRKNIYIAIILTVFLVAIFGFR
jgi:hypothetical protein